MWFKMNKTQTFSSLVVIISTLCACSPKQSLSFQTQSYLNETKEQELKIKTFNVTSSEGAPKPSTNAAEWKPDSTSYLDLTHNKELRKQYMGDAPFPKKNTQYDKGFSTQTCCGSSIKHWGAVIGEIKPSVSQWGVYAGHRVNTSQTFPTDDTLLYSPTTLPPNHAPIEVSNIYYRSPGSSQTQKVFGVFDHTGIYASSSSNWVIYKQMDSTWLSKYTANYTDGRFYFFQIMKTSSTANSWTVLLYNFQTSQWEHQGNGGNNFPLDFSTSGSAVEWGWGFHEPKFDDLCPTLEPIKLSSLKIWRGGSTWYYNTPANGAQVINGGTWCTEWGNKTWVNNYHTWTVNF